MIFEYLTLLGQNERRCVILNHLGQKTEVIKPIVHEVVQEPYKIQRPFKGTSNVKNRTEWHVSLTSNIGKFTLVFVLKAILGFI